MQRERKRRFGVNAIISRLMMALTSKRLFLSLCISISLLRPYTFFSRSPLVCKTLIKRQQHVIPVQRCPRMVHDWRNTIFCLLRLCCLPQHCREGGGGALRIEDWRRSSGQYSSNSQRKIRQNSLRKRSSKFKGPDFLCIRRWTSRFYFICQMLEAAGTLGVTCRWVLSCIMSAGPGSAFLLFLGRLLAFFTHNQTSKIVSCHMYRYRHLFVLAWGEGSFLRWEVIIHSKGTKAYRRFWGMQPHLHYTHALEADEGDQLQASWLPLPAATVVKIPCPEINHCEFVKGNAKNTHMLHLRAALLWDQLTLRFKTMPKCLRAQFWLNSCMEPLIAHWNSAVCLHSFERFGFYQWL